MMVTGKKSTAATNSTTLASLGNPGSSTFPNITSTSTGASSRSVLGNGQGLYSAFFNQTAITKVALVDGSSSSLDPTTHTNHLVYDLVESTGNESLASILKRLDEYQRTTAGFQNNDTVWGSNSVVNHTAGYSGTLSASGGTGFKTTTNYMPSNLAQVPDRFVVMGINRESDNDIQALSAYWGNLSTTSGKSDAWRGENPAQTFWSYWGHDFHSNSQTQRIGSSKQTSPGVADGATWTRDVYLLTYSAVADTAAPTIESVTSPSNDIYGPNSNLDFQVTFSESVTVTGTPRLPMTVGSTTRYANFVSLSDSRSATFRYTVQTSNLDKDRDGIVLLSPAQLNGGTISDLAGNQIIDLSFTPPNLNGVRVAQLPSAPVISSIDPGDGTLSLNFTPPEDSGSDITNYQFTSNGGSTFSAFSPVDTATPLLIQGLTNGTPYSIGIRGLTSLNGVETSGAISNFVTETPTAIEVSAPNFTVGRGSGTGAFKIDFSPVTGAASYTVKVYKSNDSFTSPSVTINNYVSGTDIRDGDPRMSCTAATPICYGIAVGHTFRFTITPVASAGYTSTGESAQSAKYGIFQPSGAITGSRTSGDEGFLVTIASPSVNPGNSGVIATAYASASNYTLAVDTASIVGSSSNSFPLPGGETYTVTLKFLGATVGDTVWFDSDESSGTFPIFVLNKPNAPTNISAERTGSESIRISWTRASGPYQTYYYHVSTDGVNWGLSRGNTTSDSATITGLTNGIAYYVRLYAFGSGAYARTSDFVIMSGTITPAGTPGPVATGGSSMNSNRINLTWTAPSITGGSPITGYLIEFSSGSAIYSESRTALSSDTSIALTGLTNGLTYYVRIKAVNEVGAGDAVEFGGGSGILVQGTAGSTVGAVTSITRTSATISATINARGNTTTPTLRWGLADGTQTDVTLTAVSADNVIVTSNLSGLLPGRRYQVTSTTSPGVSEDVGGRAIYFTTTPDSVTGVSYTTTTSSITVSWDYNPGGSGYSFSYDAIAQFNGVQAGSDCTNITSASGGRSSCEFTGLDANTAYTFSITASITGGDYGNGTSEAYVLTASTDPNIATITLTVNGGNLTLQRGSTINIVAATNVAGRVTLRLNGRAIKTCKNKSTTSLSVTCVWRPSVHGSAQLSALFNPTSNLYTNVTSRPTTINVVRRTGTRS